MEERYNQIVPPLIQEVNKSLYSINTHTNAIISSTANRKLGIKLINPLFIMVIYVYTYLYVHTNKFFNRESLNSIISKQIKKIKIMNVRIFSNIQTVIRHQSKYLKFD